MADAPRRLPGRATPLTSRMSLRLHVEAFAVRGVTDLVSSGNGGLWQSARFGCALVPHDR